MKRLLALILFCFAVTCPLSSQVVDASACDILANPQSFDGKTVRIKGTVIAGFDEFAGKERDAGSGLDNFGARYDLSRPGCFMTSDPLLQQWTTVEPADLEPLHLRPGESNCASGRCLDLWL
jgi:hypothetical protein